MTSETKHTFCRICEASCGLEMQLVDGKITAIKPNAEHIGTEGFACMKGLNQHAMYDSPDRLTTPLKRVGDAREVGDVVSFLLSDKAAYVTGETIYVDGGRLGMNYTC